MRVESDDITRRRAAYLPGGVDFFNTKEAAAAFGRGGDISDK